MLVSGYANTTRCNQAKLQLPLRCCLGCSISPGSIALVLSSADNAALIFAAEIPFKLVILLTFSTPVPSNGDNDVLTSAVEMLLKPYRLRDFSGVLSDLLVSSGLSQVIEMHNAAQNWDDYVGLLSKNFVT